MPVVSVIMATYKEEEVLLRKAMESILNQTYTDFEYIIILDNPENEEHKRIIRSYKDERIRFFINEKNSGLTASLNKALSLAKGEYIVRMDADDISFSTRIEKQLHYLQSNGYDLVGGRTDVIDEDGKDLYGVGKIPEDPEKIKKLLLYSNCVAHPTWLGRKCVFDQLKGYRNYPYCEDYDFQIRACLQGFKLSNLNEVVLQYRMTKSSISRSNLYPQYLSMKYLTAQYKKGKIANIEECKRYIEVYNIPKKADKYSLGNKNFNAMLEAVHSKRYGIFFVNGVKTVFSSKEYMNKVFRMLMLSIHA